MRFLKGSLRRINTVANREFFSSMGSAAAWVFLVIFLVMSSLCTFVVSDILAAGQADLSAFFNWMPWLFLFLVPALGMPLWSEERRTGTFELSLSFPVTLWELVIGKYAAGLRLLAIALILTFSVPLTMYWLGSPDFGAVACGYIGAFLAGAAFLAVSCFCSALTKSQTASFLMSLMICAVIVFTGWDRVMDVLRGFLPDFVCRVISCCTLIPHYQAFQRGLFDTSELVYCIALSVLFLFYAKASLEYSAAGTGSLFEPGTLRDSYTRRALGKLIFSAVGGFYVFFCIVYGAGVFHCRFDWTGDRAYSLSRDARKAASSMVKPLTIRFYCSPPESGMPRELQLYASRVQWLLREFESASSGMIRVVFIAPEQDSIDEEAALLEGLKPLKTPTGDRFFLGLSVSSGANSIPIPFLSPRQETQLEYEILRVILNTTRLTRPSVGVISSFHVLGRRANAQTAESAIPPWYIFGELSKDADFTALPSDLANIPSGIRTLMLVHPPALPKRTLYAIDQFLMRGGRLAVFLDPRSAFAMAHARKDHSYMNLLSSGFDLLPAWGIRWNPDLTAADLNFKLDRVTAGGIRQTVPTALCMTSAGMNRTNPLTSGLTAMRLNLAGFFLAVKPVPGLKYEDLLFTTEKCMPVSADWLPEQVLAGFSKKNLKSAPLVLAMKISGRFPSAYPNGAPDSGAAVKENHLKSSRTDGEVILVSDSDMLFHDACIMVSSDEYGQPVPVRKNDNIAFVENVLEYLNGSDSLSSLRSRVPMNRPLTRINDSRLRADMAFKEKALGLVQEFNSLQKQVEHLRKVLIAEGGRTKITQNQRVLLDTWSRKETEFKRQMKEIRVELRSELDSITRVVRTVNIVLVPALAAIAGIVWGVCRRFSRRHRS